MLGYVAKTILTAPVEIDESGIDLTKQFFVEEVQWCCHELQQVYYETTGNETEHKQQHYYLSFLEPSDYRPESIGHLETVEKILKFFTVQVQ